MNTNNKPALVLVDIQKGFEDLEYWGGHRNNPGAEQTAGRLLEFWRKNKLPVYHIKHCSSNPESRLAEGKPGNEFNDFVTPADTETIIKKNVNSAFIGTDLRQRLDDQGIKSLVIAGLTTDHCISSTVRMAGNFGFITYVVSDATATFDKTGPDGNTYSAELIHEISLASLHNEFAEVVSSATLLKRLGQ